MLLIKAAQQAILHALWERYVQLTPVVQTLMHAYQMRNQPLPPLDHFAVIDLPGAQTGIPTMRTIFERLQFQYRGCGYLEEKQNAFAWLGAADIDREPAQSALPQIVIADFKLEALPPRIAEIVTRYASLAPSFPFDQLDHFIARLEQGDETAISHLVQLITTYFEGRAWPMPTHQEFEAVRSMNELLAWVLVFGRRPNHFTFSIHLSQAFSSFETFLDWVENDLSITLNDQAGRIKGDAKTGIQQASTHQPAEAIPFAEGMAMLSAPFIEFVWRHPVVTSRAPYLFSDYFTDFIPANADHVVESLYDSRT